MYYVFLKQLVEGEVQYCMYDVRTYVGTYEYVVCMYSTYVRTYKFSRSKVYCTYNTNAYVCRVYTFYKTLNIELEKNENICVKQIGD